MTRREGWLVALPTAVVAVSWWVIETLVPNLIPIPARWAWTVVGVSAAAAALVLAVRAAHSLRRRRPGPWIARPFGRSARWMRERPRLSILLASASATFGISTLDALTVHLTVHRNVARSRRPCVISFEDAVLIDVTGRETTPAPRLLRARTRHHPLAGNTTFRVQEASERLLRGPVRGAGSTRC